MQRAAPFAPESAPGRAPTILVADDSLVDRLILEGLLSAEGFRVLTAPDGASARELARSHQPDLILLDVMMQGEGGFEACGKLKREQRTAEIPVIFLSSLGDVGSKVTGLRIGGVDYITKPYQGVEVLARVRVHLRGPQIWREWIRHQQANMEQLREAQQSLLVQLRDCPEAAFAVCYEPLDSAGGDYYDVVRIADDIHGYFVADVSGHGVAVSLLTSALKASLRLHTGPQFSAEDTMKGVNATMRLLFGDEQYLTAGFVCVNRRRSMATLLSAAHPPLIHLTADGGVSAVAADGEPLGIFGSVVLQRKEFPVSDGDRLFLYTDGLIEANCSRDCGMARLMEACVRRRSLPLASAVRTIVEDVATPNAAPQDDRLLLAIEVRAA